VSIDPFLLCVVCCVLCVLCGWCASVMCLYLYVRGLYLWIGAQLFFGVCVDVQYALEMVDNIMLCAFWVYHKVCVHSGMCVKFVCV